MEATFSATHVYLLVLESLAGTWSAEIKDRLVEDVVCWWSRNLRLHNDGKENSNA